MKALLSYSAKCLLLVSLALLWSADRTWAAQSKGRPAPVTVSTNAARAATPVEIPKSVFAVPNSARDLRNPFFPQAFVQPTPTPQPVRTGQPQPPPKVETSVFVLNGITASGPKPTAMINSHTFEAGETGEVKLASGAKVLVKCEEIRNESVIILADGQRRELKLRFGL
ncbi:MAG TPA: hypothetical protein VJA21_11845 [Verrucomicrobiae bacterium]